MKELPVEWYVFREDWNSKQIINYNIFEHVSFVIWCAKDIKKHKNEYFTLETLIRRELQYYFWSKCEMEVIISDWPTSGKIDRKVDIYEQVYMNWDIFYAYFWEHRNEIQKLGEEWNRKWGR